MRKNQLQLDHFYKNRFVGRHYLKSTRLTILGSSRGTDIRLLGDAVGEIHASIECQNETWIVSDLGSSHGTWTQKQPLIHYEVKDSSVIQIGQHQLKLQALVLEQKLFNKSQTESLAKNGELFHQVVIRRNGLLIENSLSSRLNPYEAKLGTEKVTLPPPPDEQWIVSRHNDYEIRQRLVRVEQIKESLREKLKHLYMSDLRWPMILSGLLLLLIASLILFLPQEPKGKLTNLKPEDQNQYTRMIYDSVKVKKQKVESQKLTKQLSSNISKTEAPKMGGSEKSGGSSTKVINNLKSSGLSALIGKISARAAKNVKTIRSVGVVPETSGSGKALNGGKTIGSLAPNQLGSSANEEHKIGGVGTAGKGGGSGTYKGFGSMALGNTGNASVGLLEEESEVEGGLDKDVIARYIKSQLGQIRYCYERQLSANPDLYGKILVKFVIGSSGEVTTQSIGVSTLKSAMVEGCILRRVASWKFPTPKGGTKVIVSYPFLFKSIR
ncbi:MAG: AgmX/PglI C-terminal domain-containing protein [Bdellovibrionales bacterium]|nr:AgmX/PglI C-terminal domain-containing protein [Bdellovibrionales bacterium]